MKFFLFVLIIAMITAISAKKCSGKSDKILIKPDSGFTCEDFPDSKELKWSDKPFFDLFKKLCHMDVCLNDQGIYDGPNDNFEVY